MIATRRVCRTNTKASHNQYEEEMNATSTQAEETFRIDLSSPDNTELVRGRSLLFEALWFFFGAPILASRVMPSSILRAILLRLFGAKIGVGVYIKPGVRVKFPWYLSVGDHCWIGEDVWIDNLAPVSIGSHVCVSQGAYICTGNHDWSKLNMRLFVKPIRLEMGSWVGARGVVCPGVTIAEGAILTAGSVATRDIPSFEIHTGNPATFVRARVMKG
jgi:putative colanic acid biosynthesis acetyltransferase WcaF